MENEGIMDEEEQEEELKLPITRYISKEIRYFILKNQKWRCNNCYCILKFSSESPWKGEVAHIDHIHPFANRHLYFNGQENINEISNLQALCPKCNMNKHKTKN